VSTDHQIIVVGGGFAGVTAARDLSQLGYRVVVLEARNRLGGRTHRRRFKDTDVEVELGGGWFAGEMQRFAHREITRYGLKYKPDPPVETFGHLLGGQRREQPFPVTWEEAVDFERFGIHLLKAALTVDPAMPADLQPLKAFDVTWEEFVAPLGLPDGLRDLVDAWALDACGGRATEDASAINHLWQTAQFGHSLVRWHTFIDQQLEGGTRALLEAIIGDCNADVRLGTPVTEVEQQGGQVRVMTAEGEVLAAAGAVIAIPVNCWPNIAFSPRLNEDKVRGAALRPGTRGVKVYALVEDAPAGFMGYGNLDAGCGLTVVNGQGEVDGAQLIFGLSPAGRREGIEDAFDPFDIELVQRAMSAYIPGAHVIATDAEDWNVEPFSNGSWSAYRIGQMEFLGGMRRPEGRLVFAGSDIARGFMTWIDGAIESGTYAAAELNRIVTADR
jgi:monoamine oxidase